jgi:hypothetical protein
MDDFLEKDIAVRDNRAYKEHEQLESSKWVIAQGSEKN